MANILKIERVKRDLNQTQVSEMLGITQAMYSLIESGNRGVNDALLDLMREWEIPEYEIKCLQFPESYTTFKAGFERGYKKGIKSEEVIKQLFNDWLKGTDNIDSVSNGWIKFSGNENLFNEYAKNNCLVKFDDGSICTYNDDHPPAIMTHFRKA